MNKKLNSDFNNFFDDHAHCSKKRNLVHHPTEITLSNQSNDHSKNFKQISKKQQPRIVAGKEAEVGLKRKSIDANSPLATKSVKLADNDNADKLNKQRESSRSYRKRQNQVKEEMEQKIFEKEIENEGLKNIKTKGYDLLRFMVQTLVTSSNITNPEKLISFFQDKGFKHMAQQLIEYFKVKQVSATSVEVVAEQQEPNINNNNHFEVTLQNEHEKEQTDCIIIDATIYKPSNKVEQQQPTIISYVMEPENVEADLNKFQEIFETRPEETKKYCQPIIEYETSRPVVATTTTTSYESSIDCYFNDDGNNLEVNFDPAEFEKILNMEIKME